MTIPTTTERVVQYSYGEPKAVLHIENDASIPALGSGDLLVKVSKSMIHPGDLHLVSAKYSKPTPTLTEARIPGFEAAGIVVDAAADSLDGTGLSVGSRVAFFAPGAWQSYAAIKADSIIGLPHDLTYEIATQLLINTITAQQAMRAALDSTNVKPHYILQTGASSAVGKIITILAIKQGMTPIRLVRSLQSAKHLEEILPGGIIIDASTQNWQQRVKDFARGEVSIVFDGVGGSMITNISSVLETGGNIISYGALDGGASDLTPLMVKSLKLQGVNIATWESVPTEERNKDKALAMEIGLEFPRVFAEYKVFKPAEIEHAISAVNTPNKKGNVLLDFD